MLDQWGIRSTSDIGEIVYNLIASGDLDKTPDDKRSDFDDVFDFAKALRPKSFLERQSLKKPRLDLESRRSPMGWSLGSEPICSRPWPCSSSGSRC